LSLERIKSGTEGTPAAPPPTVSATNVRSAASAPIGTEMSWPSWPPCVYAASTSASPAERSQLPTLR
jgi:hypothetical protein